LERKIIHVVGTGTIGEPLIGLLCDYQEQLGIDEITFFKNSPLKEDRSKVLDLIERGARLCVQDGKEKKFKKLGMDPDLEAKEAIKRSMVVIDCTPKGIGHENKKSFYDQFHDNVKGFIAQGSEDGFGKKYARGINDKVLLPKDQFIQVVSCNTHNISCMTNTIAIQNHPDNLIEGKYVCVRRANDISQPQNFIPSPQVNMHVDDKYGSHHAADAAGLFSTIGLDLNLFSSAMRVNSQYMHVLWFNLKVKEPTTLSNVKEKLMNSDFVSMTNKDLTSSVFSFGRDHGHYGRIMNQTVVVEQTLHVRNEHEISGFCFTPQDGNSILSSISAAEWFLYPHSYQDKIQCLSKLFFNFV